MRILPPRRICRRPASSRESEQRRGPQPELDRLLGRPSNQSFLFGSGQPILSLVWNEAQGVADLLRLHLSGRAQEGFELPTEHEIEFVLCCRARSVTSSGPAPVAEWHDWRGSAAAFRRCSSARRRAFVTYMVWPSAVLSRHACTATERPMGFGSGNAETTTRVAPPSSTSPPSFGSRLESMDFGCGTGSTGTSAAPSGPRAIRDAISRRYPAS